MTLTNQPVINVARRHLHKEQPTTPSSAKRLARTAGLLYLTVAILGGFAHLVVRGTVYVQGDAATTAANVQAHADLVLIGVLADLTQATIFAFLGMTLYRLLKHVNKDAAGAMLILVAIATTIICLNMVFQYAGLLVATETYYTTAIGPEGANTLVLLLFDIQRHGYLIAQIFFGLWLIPLGHLAHRSRAFPNALGVLLIIGGASYLAGTFIEFLVPDVGGAIETLIYIPPTIAELWMIAYLMRTGFGPPILEPWWSTSSTSGPTDGGSPPELTRRMSDPLRAASDPKRGDSELLSPRSPGSAWPSRCKDSER